MRSTLKKRLLAGSILLAAAYGHPVLANEQKIDAYPSQDAAKTLDGISSSSGLQILYANNDLDGVVANAVHETDSPSGALDQALKGTGLEYAMVNDRTAVVRKAAFIQDETTSGGTQVTGSGGSTGRDRIVVTAQKKEQDLQDVALSVQAFSGEDLDNQGVQNVQDLQLRTPGFTMGSNVVFGQPYIRGIGNGTLTIGSDSSVAVHLDGVYLTRPMSAYQEFFDVERVEVLKGPQGTLYGRNATGGVLNIISAKPTDEFEASARFTYGNYNQLRGDATVSGPLAEGVAMRLTGFRAKRDGFTENAFDGSDLDDQDIWGVRGQLLLEPADNFSVLVAGDISREDSTRGQGFRVTEPGGGSAGATFFDDPFIVSKDYPARTYTKAYGVSATADLALDGVNIKSITAYRHSEFMLSLDLDASDNAHSFVDPENEDSDTITQELQIYGGGDGFDWLIGGFYLNEEASTLFDINILPSTRVVPNGFTTVNAYAVFGQATLRLADQLGLTVGARWSGEDKEARVRTAGATPSPFTTASEDWSAFTPRVALEYTPADNVMLYASYTKGFKSGGFNATSTAVPGFDPEKINSYEVGLRSTWGDGLVTANLTGFYYDYSDLQVRALVSGIISGVSNAAKADIKGLEGQFDLNPTDEFSLNLNVSWLDAEFGEFLTTDPDSAMPMAVIDLAGNRLSRAPELQLSGGAQYEWDLGNESAFLIRGDVSYQSKVFFDEFNYDTRSQDGFATLSGKVGYTLPGGNLTVDVWAKNITDKAYAVNVLRSAGFYGTATWYGAPRTFGVSLTGRL
ncbi:TonB-dependent receptor [Hyphococcus flavus]|uniref:TonB-dependent receptor n=1 Tax=Hyphococcus flavus TaxID=1866326 RepID=A0AAE9ZBS6_9PROT|nr:TonB-dependent receptor [Hyphococcus flavus]WDI31838.1 TonB-dependent receptor [Hyphococcus flavus]